MTSKFTSEEMVPVLYEAMRALGVQQDGGEAAHWEDLDPAECQEIREQLVVCIDKLRSGMPPAQVHDEWCEDARRLGWHYGPEQNVVDGTDPRIVKWDELLPEDRQQIEITCAIVGVLS